MRTELEPNGFGDPHPTHRCRSCKTEYWIVEGKPTRTAPEIKEKEELPAWQQPHWGM